MSLRRITRIAAWASVCFPLGVLAQASSDGPTPTESSVSSGGAGQRAEQADEPIYGRQMMTQEEMTAYRDKMRAATTQEERERLRDEHHATMVERARERGIALPDAPPARGQAARGMGPGDGMGAGTGMGTSGAMGSGPGSGTGMGPGGGAGPGQRGGR